MIAPVLSLFYSRCICKFKDRWFADTGIEFEMIRKTLYLVPFALYNRKHVGGVRKVLRRKVRRCL